MRKYKLRILDYITSELLVLCWRDLLIKEKNSNCIYNNKRRFFEPLSKNWFKKTSYLISTGNFNYKIFNEKLSLAKHPYTKNLLKKLKLLIIQNAFIVVLRVYFNNYLLGYYNLCGIGILI